jgi:hypothetical protein
MAEELDSYDWDEANDARSKYDWTRWLKGDIWRIRQAEDYAIATETMRVTLHAKADKKGLKVRTRKETGQGWEGLVFQFYDPDEDGTEA